jgi:peptide chain release factor 2
MLQVEELLSDIRDIQQKFEENWKTMKLDNYPAEIKDLEEKMSDPSFWDNPEEGNRISQEFSHLKKVYQEWKDFRDKVSALLEITEMLKTEEDEALYRDVIREYEEIRQEYAKKELYLYFGDKFDPNSAYLSINAGAGGTEANDWVSMLSRMYLRWGEIHEFETEVVDELPGEEAGIKNITIFFKGAYVYGNLKGERGVHRLVRISPFDSNARRHTSFASVSVIPEVEEDIEIEINPSDLRIDTYRASGAGGQHVNKTDSAVRIVHQPSGIIVQCQQERSQHKNREKAMKLLKAKLYQHYEKEKEAEQKKLEGEKKDIAWGSQIRSYVFHPYNLIKDHRTGCETGNVEKVMDGGIDQFIFEYLKWDLKKSTA